MPPPDFDVIERDLPGLLGEGIVADLARADLRDLLTYARECREVLASIEWAGHIPNLPEEYDGDDSECPSCGSERVRRSVPAGTHYPTCRLAALIK